MDSHQNGEAPAVNPLGDFEAAVRTAADTALRAGVPPIVVKGILDAVSLDLYMQMRQRAGEARRSSIIRAAGLPARG